MHFTDVTDFNTQCPVDIIRVKIEKEPGHILETTVAVAGTLNATDNTIIEAEFDGITGKFAVDNIRSIHTDIPDYEGEGADAE